MSIQNLQKPVAITMLAVSAALSVPIVGVPVTQAISVASSPMITSQQHLEQVIARVKGDLDCDKTINAFLHNKPISRASRDGNGYTLAIYEGLATESVVKHETYHACKGHPDEDFEGVKKLKHVIWEEPLATLYQIEIKL